VTSRDDRQDRECWDETLVLSYETSKGATTCQEHECSVVMGHWCGPKSLCPLIFAESWLHRTRWGGGGTAGPGVPVRPRVLTPARQLRWTWHPGGGDPTSCARAALQTAESAEPTVAKGRREMGAIMRLASRIVAYLARRRVDRNEGRR